MRLDQEVVAVKQNIPKWVRKILQLDRQHTSLFLVLEKEKFHSQLHNQLCVKTIHYQTVRRWKVCETSPIIFLTTDLTCTPTGVPLDTAPKVMDGAAVRFGESTTSHTTTPLYWLVILKYGSHRAP